MEKLMKFIAKHWYNLEEGIKITSKNHLFKNVNSTFTVLIILILLVGVLTGSQLNYNFKTKLLIIFSYTLIGATAILIAGAFYEKEKLKKEKLYPFTFRNINFNLIDFNVLAFNSAEKMDFILLLNGKKVKNKINFKERNRSKESGNHRSLFSMLDVLLEEDVTKFEGIEKDIFFDMLTDSLVMNNSEFKSATLESSFSEWKSDNYSFKREKYSKYWRKTFNLK